MANQFVFIKKQYVTILQFALKKSLFLFTFSFKSLRQIGMYFVSEIDLTSCAKKLFNFQNICDQSKNRKFFENSGGSSYLTN